MSDSLAACVEACGWNKATSSFLTCTEDCFSVAGWKHPSTQFALPAYAAILLASGLVVLSGLFSGLNVGLLSLDLTGLRILESAGEDDDERKFARHLIPVRMHGNLLLCTLLLGGTVLNSAIAIVLSDLTTGAVGLLSSTLLILVFGEIIPQALCTRHSLKIGYYSIPVVRLFMLLFLPLTWPISKILDAALSMEVGTLYNQQELKRLIALHVEDPEAQRESGLTKTDQRLLTGVLEYKDKTVADVMTRLEHCFMLPANVKLDFQAMSKIYISGCSRVPVYEGSRHNIIGTLFAKDLILVDPDDELDITAVMAFRGRAVRRVYDDVTLDKVLSRFLSSSGGHMLIAHTPPSGGDAERRNAAYRTPVTGLITLEDVLEELIKTEIYDESDADTRPGSSIGQRLGGRQLAPYGGLGGARSDLALYLDLFGHKAKGLRLSNQEVVAVCAFLAASLEEFRPLAASDAAFKGLLRTAEVLERGAAGSTGAAAAAAGPLGAAWPPQAPSWEARSGGGGGGGGPTGEVLLGRCGSGRTASGSGAAPLPALCGRGPNDPMLLYERGRASSSFCLILQGKVLIHTGAEGFELEVGPWSYLGNKALLQEGYTPDFDAAAVPPFRIIRISRAAMLAALDAVRIGAAAEYQAARHHVRCAAGGEAGRSSDTGNGSEGDAGGPAGAQPGGGAAMLGGWGGGGGAATGLSVAGGEVGGGAGSSAAWPAVGGGATGGCALELVQLPSQAGGAAQGQAVGQQREQAWQGQQPWQEQQQLQTAGAAVRMKGFTPQVLQTLDGGSQLPLPAFAPSQNSTRAVGAGAPAGGASASAPASPVVAAAAAAGAAAGAAVAAPAGAAASAAGVHVGYGAGGAPPHAPRAASAAVGGGGSARSGGSDGGAGGVGLQGPVQGPVGVPGSPVTRAAAALGALSQAPQAWLAAGRAAGGATAAARGGDSMRVPLLRGDGGSSIGAGRGNTGGGATAGTSASHTQWGSS